LSAIDCIEDVAQIAFNRSSCLLKQDMALLPLKCGSELLPEASNSFLGYTEPLSMFLWTRY